MRLADLQLLEAGRVVIARLGGELDLSNTGNIGGELSERIPNGALGLVLDLSALEYLDSAGIHLIYDLREKLRARGQGLQLVIPADSPAQDALRLAGVSGHVATSETIEDAVAAIG